MAFRIERSITVQAPPQAVWETVQDVSRRLEWDARVRSVKLLTPLPIGKGSRTLIDYNMWGVGMLIEIEMVSWHPHQRSGIKGRVLDSPDTIGASWNFEQNADGSTTWTTRIVVSSKGPLAWLREQLAGRATDYLTGVSQRNLKRLVESEQPAARSEAPAL